MKSGKIVRGTVLASCTYLLVFSGSGQAELPEPYLQVCRGLGGAAGQQEFTDEQKNFQNICNNLFGQPDAEDNDSVAALRHEEVAAQGTAAVQSSKRHLANVNARIGNLRKFAVGGASGDDEESELLGSSRWGFFTNGNYNGGDRAQTVGVPGSGGLGDASIEVVQGERAFDFDGQDLSFGVDYRFPNEKMILGTALGYNKQDSDFKTQYGYTNLEGYNLSAYGTYLPSDKMYFDGLISIGNSSVDASRPVPVFDSRINAVLDDEGRAFADTDAQLFSVSLGGGYEFTMGALSITPYTRLDYSKTDIDGYTETVLDNGGSSDRDSRGMALSVQDQSIDSLLGTLGIKTSYPISSSGGVFIPQASIELNHQFRNDDRFIEATLPAAGGINSVTANPNTQTSEIDRNYLKLGLGVSAVFPKGRSGYLLVESLQGNDDLSDTAIKAGFRLEF